MHSPFADRYWGSRNLLGLKRPAVLLIALCIVASVFFCIRDFQVDPTRFWAGSLVCLALLAVGLVWHIVIQMAFVETQAALTLFDF
jgi:hypothetical protein